MVTDKFPMTIGDEEVLNEHLLRDHKECPCFNAAELFPF